VGWESAGIRGTSEVRGQRRPGAEEEGDACRGVHVRGVQGGDVLAGAAGVPEELGVVRRALLELLSRDLEHGGHDGLLAVATSCVHQAVDDAWEGEPGRLGAAEALAGEEDAEILAGEREDGGVKVESVVKIGGEVV
jgi:hypothetical protein